MDLMTTPSLDELCDSVRDADVVVPIGGRTHWQVGGPPPAGLEVRAPAGVVVYEPGELTVTAGAGTRIGDLEGALAEAGQHCPLDASPAATLGGLIACGLSGRRRLRFGPLRNRLLEVRVVLADGRVIKGGGPTVKNVSGYDLPRLFVGSFGTLGVVGQVTLRCEPVPHARTWAAGATDPIVVIERATRPSTVLWDGATVHALFEGHPDDVAAEIAATGLAPVELPPWPAPLPWRGRISVRPSAVVALAPALSAAAVRWVAEVGVGTVHVQSDHPGALGAARAAAETCGGWLLREAGDGIDGFGDAGRALPNAALMRRIKDAFDPTGKMNPGRLPL